MNRFALRFIAIALISKSSYLNFNYVKLIILGWSRFWARHEQRRCLYLWNLRIKSYTNRQMGSWIYIAKFRYVSRRQQWCFFYSLQCNVKFVNYRSDQIKFSFWFIDFYKRETNMMQVYQLDRQFTWITGIPLLEAWHNTLITGVIRFNWWTAFIMTPEQNLVLKLFMELCYLLGGGF